MINRPAKITAYNYDSSTSGCEDFSMNVYWGADYKNVFYLDGTEGRSEFEQIIETVSDVSGQTKRTQNSSIEKHIVSILAISPLLAFLHSIDKCDVKEFEYLDTNEVFTITNIDIDDQGGTLDTTQLVYITFEDQPITKVSNVVFIDDDQKLAYWDNNDDGTEDIDGEAEYDAPINVFNTWQLYFESDGVTPTGSGDVIMLVYAISLTGAESLVGIFEGQFGDFWSDSNKWQSTQNIWNYFNLSDTVGHTNRVQFDKQAFAEDNGYFSDETEERAVNLRFELGINGSDREKTTLSRVYTVWGAFARADMLNSVSKEYGVTFIGKFDQKNTLDNFQDARTVITSGVTTLISSSFLTSQTPWTNVYSIDINPETTDVLFEGNFVTDGGYFCELIRGAREGCDFVWGMNPVIPIGQENNILNFTTGTSPYEISFGFLWERIASCGAFAELGDINSPPEFYLDGVLVNTYPAIIPNTPLAFVNETIILTDLEVHNIELKVVLTSNYILGAKIEFQLKSLF